MTPTPPTAPPRRPRRLLLKLLLLGAVLLLALFLAIPWLLSTSLARGRIESAASEALRTRVRIASLDIGYLSGLEIGAVEIDNPPGFDPSVKALKLRGMKGGFSWRKLLAGRFLIQGKLDGLELRVQQKKDGSSNFGTMAGVSVEPPAQEPAPAPPSGPRPQGAPELEGLDRVRFDLEVADARIDIEHEEQGLLESLRDLDIKVFKDFGAADVRVKMSAELHRPDGSPPGKLGLDIDADGYRRRPLQLRYDLLSLDFARYRPLLAAFLPADQLTAFAGVMGGRGQAFYDFQRQALRLEGNLDIAQPHFAGALLQGMDIAADRWVVTPNLELQLGEGGAPPVVKADGLRVDLGFLVVQGMASAEAAALTGGKPALGLGFDVDLAKVLKFGGPISSLVQQGKGQATGKLAFAITEDSLKPEVLKQRFSEFLNAALDVKLDSLTIEGHELTGLTAKLGLSEGKAHVDAGAVLGGGPITLGLDTDPTKLDTLPGKLTLAWKGGGAGPASTKLLRYAVPLLAGLDGEGAGVDFQSKVDCEVAFQGPLLPTSFDSTMAWLDQWTGGGKLGLLEGSFTPAGALAPLLQLTGEQGKLAFRDLKTDFVVKDGALETGLMKLSQKAGALGLKGKTKLDGTMDWTIDLSEALQGHKDGERVLALLGGKVPAASLTGTLDAPALKAPDLGLLFQQALQQGLKDEAQKAAGDLLKKGLDGLRKK